MKKLHMKNVVIASDRMNLRMNRHLPFLLLSLFASFILAVFMFPPAPVHAYPFFQEDEAGFLRWYEENKNSDNASYTLQGDLVLSSGTKDTPILLDGTGNITINCGDYVIVSCSNVIFDNPNLTLNGNSYCTVYFTDGTLSLQQGNIYADSDACYALYAAGENLSLISPGPGNRFTINAQGEYVTGLYYYCTADVVLSNLDIRVNAAQSGTGVEFLRTGAAVDYCNINVTGGLNAYGLYNYSSMQISKSCIQADGTSEDAILYSAGSPLEDAVLTWDEDSVLNPVPSDSDAMDKVYTVLRQVFEGPCTLPTGSYTPADFPDEVLCLVRNEASYENSEISIPVQWDFSPLDTSRPGVTTVYGTLDTGSLDGIFYNAGNMHPELYVVCVENNQIFLHSWSVYKSDKDSIQMQVVLPYPFGADSLRMQYSTDGIHYTDYAYMGKDNLLSPVVNAGSGALFSTSLYIPLYSPALYLRAVISGNTLFAGTSPAWKLDITSAGGTLAPDYGGDRGGQTVENNPAVTNPEKTDNSSRQTYPSSGSIITYETQKKRDSSSVSENKTDESLAKPLYEGQNIEAFSGLEEFPAHSKSTSAQNSADKKGTLSFVWMFVLLLFIVLIITGIIILKKKKNRSVIKINREQL